jgi:uncharacterized OsmC-like protein
MTTEENPMQAPATQVQERLKATFERNAKALALRPSVGQGTAVTKVKLREGLTCDIEEGRWRLTADMGAKSGGDDRGPNPGIIGRAALGSCLTVSYAMWAAKMGVPITSLEVEVQADYDARGYHGVGDVNPGYEQIRYVVTIDSDAPDEDVMRMLDTADAHCDYLFVFTQPQDVSREIRLVRS